MEEPIKKVDKRSATWIKPGQVLNPNGRPKGKSLKDFAREYLSNLTPEDKMKYIKGLDPDIVWRMAEGNPHSTNDVVLRDPPKPIADIDGV